MPTPHPVMTCPAANRIPSTRPLQHPAVAGGKLSADQPAPSTKAPTSPPRPPPQSKPAASLHAGARALRPPATRLRAATLRPPANAAGTPKCGVSGRITSGGMQTDVRACLASIAQATNFRGRSTCPLRHHRLPQHLLQRQDLHPSPPCAQAPLSPRPARRDRDGRRDRARFTKPASPGRKSEDQIIATWRRHNRQPRYPAAARPPDQEL